MMYKINHKPVTHNELRSNLSLGHVQIFPPVYQQNRESSKSLSKQKLHKAWASSLLGLSRFSRPRRGLAAFLMVPGPPPVISVIEKVSRPLIFPPKERNQDLHQFTE